MCWGELSWCEVRRVVSACLSLERSSWEIITRSPLLLVLGSGLILPEWCPLVLSFSLPLSLSPHSVSLSSPPPFPPLLCSLSPSLSLNGARTRTRTHTHIPHTHPTHPTPSQAKNLVKNGLRLLGLRSQILLGNYRNTGKVSWNMNSKFKKKK